MRRAGVVRHADVVDLDRAGGDERRGGEAGDRLRGERSGSGGDDARRPPPAPAAPAAPAPAPAAAVAPPT